MTKTEEWTDKAAAEVVEPRRKTRGDKGTRRVVGEGWLRDGGRRSGPSTHVWRPGADSRPLRERTYGTLLRWARVAARL